MKVLTPLLLILLLPLAADPARGQEQTADKAASAPLLGQESIMLTKSEQEALEKARARLPRSALSAFSPLTPHDDGDGLKPGPAALPDIGLSALIWRGAADWTAWINGAVYSRGSSLGGLRAVDATPRHVDIEVERPDRPPVVVRLQPGQVFNGASGTISEGYRR
jgi:hypothetical protein